MASKTLMPIQRNLRILPTYSEGVPMNNILTIAMPKGRIFEEAVELLRKAGYQLPPEFDDSRKLIIEVENEDCALFWRNRPMFLPM